MLKTKLLYLWQLPQHLLALVLIKLWKADYREGLYWTKKISAGLSLGRYVFIPDVVYSKKVDYVLLILHEFGHSDQSCYLGPLYLLLVGLPSVCRNLYQRKKKKDSSWYYSGYPENWADKLGGVKRS